MNFETLLTLIFTAITVLTGIVTVAIAFSKAPHENKNTDSETIKNLLESVELLEKRIKEIEIKLAEEKEHSIKIENWANRLSQQVYRLGGIPVPFDLDRPTQLETQGLVGGRLK